MTKQIKIILIVIGFVLAILLDLAISPIFKPYGKVVMIIIIGSYYFAAKAIWTYSPKQKDSDDEQNLRKS